MTELKDEPILKLEWEINLLNEKLNKYILENGIDNVAKELYFLIWVYDYNGDRKEKYIEWLNKKSGRNVLNKAESKSKIDKVKYLLENLLIDSDLFHERHDYLCLFVKELELLDASIIPKRNIYSYNESREYDPAKNAKNILKHGISFRDLTDNCNAIFGDLATHTNSKGEDRTIFFSRIRENNSFKYVMSICMLPGSDFDEKIGELADKILDKEELSGVNKREILQEKLVEIINQLKSDGILDKLPKVPALRIISARYFTEENYEEVINGAIKDENLELSVLDELKKSAIKIIEQINNFHTK